MNRRDTRLRPASNCRVSRNAGGAFTLLELLAVIAIIGILAAILIPTTTAVRASANRARSRVQFSQWATAIETFHQEYGCYPVFDPSNKVNGGASTDAATLHRFHDVLAARRRDGSALPDVASAESDPPDPAAQNSRRIPCITFTEAELFPDAYADAAERNLLHDAFDDTDIAVLVDRNLDGIINAADYPELPAVSPPDNPAVFIQPDSASFPAVGVRAGVVFYSAPPRATAATQLIMSWR